MDWMYNKNFNVVDPEEYLLGRAIDKNFIKQSSPENYMRSIRNEPPSTRKSDFDKKALEDPLTLIKQKELEKKKLLLQKTHLKFPEGVPADLLQDSSNSTERSKSIEQLVIESLRMLPIRVDLEKLYQSEIMRKKKSKKKKSKKQVDERKSDESKTDERRNERRNERSTDERRHERKRLHDRRSEERKVRERKIDDRKDRERRIENRRFYDRKRDERKIQDRKIHDSKVHDRKDHDKKIRRRDRSSREK